MERNELELLLNSFTPKCFVKEDPSLLDYFTIYLGLDYENGENSSLGFFTKYSYNYKSKNYKIESTYNTFESVVSFKEIVDFLIDVLKDELKEKFHECVEAYEKEQFEEKLSSIKDAMTTFSSNSSYKYTNQIRDGRLVNVEYHFKFSDVASYIDLNLKVGIDKFYTISNIPNFFEAIKYEREVKYGKNLTFTHSYSNFQEKDRNPLMALKATLSYYTSDKKTIALTPRIFNVVINTLKDRYVLVDENPFKVSLNPIDVKVSIDENYKLHTTLSPIARLYKGDQDYLYVFDYDNHEINYIDPTTLDVNLIMWAHKFEDFDLNLVLDDFKKDVYIYKQGEIEIAPKIQKDFDFNTITIKAYFDYNNNKITVTTKYFSGDEEIKRTDIKDYASLIKISNYLTFLNNIGFNKEDELVDNSDVYHFFIMDFSQLKKICEVYLSESIANKQVVTFKPPVLRVNYHNNLLSFLLEDSKYSDEELYKILKAIRSKKKYFMLNDNTIMDLTNKEGLDFNNIVTDLKLNDKQLNKEVIKPLYQSFKLQNYESNVSLDSHVLDIINNLANFKEAKFPLPKLKATLRPYQIEGFNWLKILTSYNLGGILADDMGLGKTLEIITLLKSDETKKPSLIVCPKSLIYNWHSEFNKFDGDTKVVEIYGSVAERKNVLNNINYHEKVIYITSYDSLRNDDYNKDETFNYLIIDEGQFIKNINAKKTISVKGIKALHKFALTGTPIENNTLDLWSLFDYIMPDYLPDLEQFKASSNNNDDEFLANLSRKIAPFILRRSKKEVLPDLPNKYERVVTADLTVEQEKLYDAYVLKAKDTMSDSDNAMIEILSIITRLRQICVDPQTFVSDYNGSSGKMEILMDLIKEYQENNHKMLVFSQFVKALDIVEQKLKKEKIPYYKLTGETSAKDRTDLANKFNNNDVPVFLISLKAGGTGLNLIGADTIIHLDPWWNVAAENQATDRSHRIGQTKNVEVIKLICRNTIEQRVVELQNIKKDLIDKLIAKDESAITKLSKEDLAFILS